MASLDPSLHAPPSLHDDEEDQPGLPVRLDVGGQLGCILSVLCLVKLCIVKIRIIKYCRRSKTTKQLFQFPSVSEQVSLLLNIREAFKVEKKSVFNL